MHLRTLQRFHPTSLRLPHHREASSSVTSSRSSRSKTGWRMSGWGGSEEREGGGVQEQSNNNNNNNTENTHITLITDSDLHLCVGFRVSSGVSMQSFYLRAKCEISAGWGLTIKTKESWWALEERVRCRARPHGGRNTQTDLGKKESGLSFTPIYQPDCSSIPHSWPSLCDAAVELASLVMNKPFNNHLCWWKSDMTHAQMCTDDFIFKRSCIHITLNLVHWLSCPGSK